MTIEPIGSVMSAQAASSYTPPKTEAPDGPKEGSQPQTNVPDINPVDGKTLTVAKPDGKDPQADSDGNQQDNASTEEIKKALEKITKNINNSNEEAIFGIHKGTNRVTIKIVDKDTKETIKELPPEKTLDMIAKLWEVAGIMVDERR